jgi:hypothetical protein
MYKEDCDLAYRLYLAGGVRAGADAIISSRPHGSERREELFNSSCCRSKQERQVRFWVFQEQALFF